MVKRSHIEWTDFSAGLANFVWRGSQDDDCKISPGCAHCYVDRIIARMPDKWPAYTTVYPDKLERLLFKSFKPKDVPFRRGEGSSPLVFVCDTGDLFHQRVPAEFVFIALDGFVRRADVTWQILTKRAQRAEMLVSRYVTRNGLDRLPRNIWLGVTAENPLTAKVRIPALLNTPAAFRWVSAEPLIEFTGAAPYHVGELDWLVAGGESGTNARDMPAEWARALRDACRQRSTAFFMKQMSGKAPIPDDLLIRQIPD
jgi:protein gp37